MAITVTAVLDAPICLRISFSCFLSFDLFLLHHLILQGLISGGCHTCRFSAYDVNTLFLAGRCYEGFSYGPLTQGKKKLARAQIWRPRGYGLRSLVGVCGAANGLGAIRNFRAGCASTSVQKLFFVCVLSFPPTSTQSILWPLLSSSLYPPLP